MLRPLTYMTDNNI